MARLLIAATAVPGHVWPLLTVARHLAGLGHDVVLHTGSVFRDRAEATGARFVPFRPAIDLDYRRLDERFPQRRAIPSGALQVAFGLKYLFADALPHQYAGLRDILADFPADAVIVDTMFCGAFPLLLGRRETRPPVVSLGVSALALSSVDTAPFGMGLPPPGTQEERIRSAALNRQFQEVIFAETQRYFNAVLAKVGVPALPAFLFDSMITLPDLYLQLATAAFEYPRRDLPATVRFIGPIASPSPDIGLPPWWDLLDGPRPVVVVTQGTLQNADFGQLVGPTLTALAAEPVTVVAATGGPVEAIPIALPPNARASSFLPFDRLLPKAAVLVTNGGYGAVTQALSLGVPLVVAGDSEEKPEIAARVAWSGAGINLRTGRPSVPQIRDAVRALLTRPQYRLRAQAIRDDFARHNALDRIAELVDDLTGDHGAMAGRNSAVDRQFQDRRAGSST
jgi:MGT family glycosyltransferase